MALIVEDGSGISSAESYATVAFADDYHSKYGNSLWSTLSLNQKELDLRKGTRFIDLVWGSRFSGIVMSNEQGLAWPRIQAFDYNGYQFDSNIVPIDLQRATAEAALIAQTQDLMPNLDFTGIIKSERDKVGPLESEIVYIGGKSQYAKFTTVEYYLNRLLGVSTNNGYSLERS
jgi:hypothetical protein